VAIVVQCSGCPTRLSAPEGAAGKQLKCPKCGSLATVPEQVVETKPAQPPRPKPKVTADPVDDDDDRPRSRTRRDDDDDDDDDRPRKKKRRGDDDDDEYDHDRKRGKRRSARNSGGGGGKMAVMVVVGLVALIGVGVAIFMLVGKGSRAPLPPGWTMVENADAGVKGAFPTDPMVIGNRGNFGFGAGMNIPGFGEIPQVESSHVLTCGGGLGGRAGVNVSVQVTRFRGALPRAMRDAVADGFGGAALGGEAKSVRWLGGSGVEMRVGGQIVRQVYTDKAIVQATVNGAKPEEAEAFFDNFELTK